MADRARIIDGRALAASVRRSVKSAVHAAIESRPAPHLAVVLASDDPASAVYVRNKGRAAEEVGIRSTQHTLPSHASRGELLEVVRHLNASADVDGVLVQLPLPPQHDADEVIQAIDPAKDVDGLHPINAGKLARGDETGLIPCTPLGCIRLIEAAGVSIAGRHAAVLGRSRLVGRPVAELLINRHATVTVCHSQTRNLADEIYRAEILIAAIGKPEYVKGSWIRPGAVVIDVGINRTADGGLVGDVAFHAAIERARAITPVPGGVGPMTIACLLENTLSASKKRG